MNEYRNLIIDLNNIYHKSFGILSKDILVGKELLNKTIQLTLKQIFNLKKNYLAENGTCYVIADNPTSKKVIRKELDPQYKANRLKENDPFYRGIDYTLLILNNYDSCFKTARIKTMEADDLVKPLLESFNKYDKTLLVSTDLDWARSLADNIHWLQNKVLYTPEIFKQKYKFNPTEDKVTLYKSLHGDISDNIPCIEGLNNQTILNLVNNFKDVFEIIDTVSKNLSKNSLLSEYTKNVILKNKNRLILNHQLVYFSFVSEEEIKQAVIDGSYNQKTLMVLYNSLEFPKNFDERIKYKKKDFNEMFDFDSIKRK